MADDPHDVVGGNAPSEDEQEHQQSSTTDPNSQDLSSASLTRTRGGDEGGRHLAHPMFQGPTDLEKTKFYHDQELALQERQQFERASLEKHEKQRNTARNRMGFPNFQPAHNQT